MNYGTLFLVGLPVGNWEDMPPRSKKYIQSAKNVVVENSETFINICNIFDIEHFNKNIISIRYESDGTKPGKQYEVENIEKIISLLKSGEDLYVISDEGMPGIADPGSFMVKECIKNKINVSSTPGPSVIIAAAAVTGVMHNFILESFLPFDKTEKITFLQNKKNHEYPMIIMLRNAKNQNEFNNEIPEFLENACSIWGENKNASLCYNLTTNKELVIHGPMKELFDYFNSTKRDMSDQICIVIH
jgi:16S rRNA (cytidine1402-2'-O)-methyltransferase